MNDELQQLEARIDTRRLFEDYAQALVDLASGSTERADHFVMFSSAIESMRSSDYDCYDLVIRLTQLTVEQKIEAARKVLGE